MKRLSSHIIFCLLALSAGMCAVGGWAPFGWWLLAIAGYSVLTFLVVYASSVWTTILYSSVFACGLHFVGHGWITTALFDYAGVARFNAFILTGVLVFYLALFTVLPCVLWKRCFMSKSAGRQRMDLLGLMSFSALLILGEWLRTQFFNGISSLSLGYALIDTWLSGYAPVLGMYGVGFFGFLCSAVIAYIVGASRLYKCTVVLAIIAVIIVGGWVAASFKWVEPSGAPLRYRLIQTGIAQDIKFSPAQTERQIKALTEAIQQAPADLIVTPETAFPVLLNVLPPDVLTDLQYFSRYTRSHLFIGIPVQDSEGRLHNSVLHMAPANEEIARYDKVRLMPFGEYAPTGLQWLTAELVIPFKDLTPGPSEQPAFNVNKHQLGVLICHEDGFGSDARRWAAQTSLLINPNNLAWFDHGWAAVQRLQMARMIALENGRPILRASNRKMTALIGYRGDIVAMLNNDMPGVLTGTVQPVQGLTPYVRFGDMPVIILLALIVVIQVWVACFRNPAKSEEDQFRWF